MQNLIEGQTPTILPMYSNIQNLLMKLDEESGLSGNQSVGIRPYLLTPNSTLLNTSGYEDFYTSEVKNGYAVQDKNSYLVQTLSAMVNKLVTIVDNLVGYIFGMRSNSLGGQTTATSVGGMDTTGTAMVDSTGTLVDPSNALLNCIDPQNHFVSTTPYPTVTTTGSITHAGTSSTLSGIMSLFDIATSLVPQFKGLTSGIKGVSGLMKEGWKIAKDLFQPKGVSSAVNFVKGLF